MTNKDHFIKFVDSVNQFCVDNGYFDEEYDYNLDKAKAFFDSLKKDAAAENGEPTEKGKNILAYIQDNYDEGEFKSSDVASGMGLTSRAVTGSMLKLVNDGYLNKESEKGVSPVVYSLADKGRNYKC